MSAEELAQETGLPLFLALLAKERDYDEPFKIAKGNKKDVLSAILQEGLCYVDGGRYLHIVGDSDKGYAFSVLKSLYLKQFGELLTRGVGNSSNDLSMLELVDYPFVG